jgi:hypothetical protein
VLPVFEHFPVTKKLNICSGSWLIKSRPLVFSP